ncbi:MAG: glycosyltransferase family 1 protein, partial [Verrucomicrobiaceae bacterium]
MSGRVSKRQSVMKDKRSIFARRKIIISINTSWNIINFRAGLVIALLRQGHEVVAISPSDRYVPRLEEMGCRHIPISMDNEGTNPVKDAGLLLRYFEIMRAEKPDIFLAWTIKPNIYGSLAARFLGVPAINNISGLGRTFLADGWLRRIVKILYRVALGRSSRIFFQNDHD